MYTNDTLGYPDLYFRGRDDVTHFVRKGARNPMPVGKYLFFGGIHVVPSGVGMKKNLSVIGGYDIATNSTFTVLEGAPEDGLGWNMPMGMGYSKNSFVIWSDLAWCAPNPEAAAKAPLHIRKYTVSGS